MALGTEEATFNAAVDTLMAAWEVLTDHVSAGECIPVVWVDGMKGDLAADSTQGVDTNATFGKNGRVYYWYNNPNTTDSTVLKIGPHPLFFKVTNAAGDLS